MIVSTTNVHRVVSVEANSRKHLPSEDGAASTFYVLEFSFTTEDGARVEFSAFSPMPLSIEWRHE